MLQKTIINLLKIEEVEVQEKLEKVLKHHKPKSQWIAWVKEEKKTFEKIVAFIKEKSWDKKALYIQENIYYGDYAPVEVIRTLNRDELIENSVGKDFSTFVFNTFPYFILTNDPNFEWLLISPQEWKQKYSESLGNFVKKVNLRKQNAKGIYPKALKTFFRRSVEKDVRFAKFFYKKDKKDFENMETIFVWYRENMQKFIKRSLQKNNKKAYVIPSHFKRLSYKSLVKDYYGIDLIEGKNAPKLTKQLTKKGIEFTHEEMVAFGEAKRVLSDIAEKETSLYDTEDFIKLGELYIDTEDMQIPNFVDQWAFRGSCNQSCSYAGRDTHLILKNFYGFSYLKIYQKVYTSRGIVLAPTARAYFYKKDDDIAHAGGYSDYNGDNEGQTAYYTWSLIFCTLFNKKFKDFKLNKGMNLHNNKVDAVAYYSNMSAYTDYSTYSTSANIFKGLYDLEEDYVKDNIEYLSMDYVNKEKKENYFIKLKETN